MTRHDRILLATAAFDRIRQRKGWDFYMTISYLEVEFDLDRRTAYYIVTGL